MSHQISVFKDLRSQFGVVRDQGDRPTCLAFAASDAHASQRQGWVPLSCEYAFYRAQQRAGRAPSEGAVLGSMLAAIELDGQPEEQAWPYWSATPHDLAAWSPPPVCLPLFRRFSSCWSLDFDHICQAINEDKPIIILIKLSDGFFHVDPQGVFHTKPGQVPQQDVGHAMVAVAHGLLNGIPAILARNSWGSDWGNAGHVWLPKPFVEYGLYGAAIMEGEA